MSAPTVRTVQRALLAAGWRLSAGQRGGLGIYPKHFQARTIPTLGAAVFVTAVEGARDEPALGEALRKAGFTFEYDGFYTKVTGAPPQAPGA